MSDAVASFAPPRRRAIPRWKLIGRQVEPDDLATLIYTSGTTGTPKGVMLTHGNIASNLNVSLDMYEFDKNDLCVSFLPLSHVTARHLDYALVQRGRAIWRTVRSSTICRGP